MMREYDISEYFDLVILETLLSRNFNEVQFRQKVANGPYKTKLYIYANDADRHHLPHVHVVYPSGDFVVSLVDCTLIKGKLNSNIKKVFLHFFETNKEDFLAIWKTLNQTDKN